MDNAPPNFDQDLVKEVPCENCGYIECQCEEESEETLNSMDRF